MLTDGRVIWNHSYRNSSRPAANAKSGMDKSIKNSGQTRRLASGKMGKAKIDARCIGSLSSSRNRFWRRAQLHVMPVRIDHENLLGAIGPQPPRCETGTALRQMPLPGVQVIDQESVMIAPIVRNDSLLAL